jgi:phosphoglycolate phosphatase
MFGKAAKFRRVLKMSGIAAARAICIGDEIRDYEAAREVGLAFGAVSWGYTDPVALSALKPQIVFHSVADLAPALIGERVRAA